MKTFEETFNCPVVEGYGLSESTCRSTFNPPNERRPGSCGLPIGNEMKVFDDNDREVVDGELGEIVLRGENILKGYYKNPEATSAAFRNGWFHTNDIGYRDQDGYFFIVDRKSDMIIRGGENIYPREVEEFLYTHPDVADVQVIGVPSEKYGEEVMAWVKPREGAKVTGEELAAWCKGKIASFKIPRHWKLVDSFPMTVTGKVQKFKMREAAVEELGLEKAAGIRTA
jgi:fatty-acyl-CoA synthase